jgi:galactonate dehydratase
MRSFQGADLFTYVKDPSAFGVKEGHVQASELPGLGIELNEELIREVSAKTIKEGKAWRNAVWRGEDGSLREW